MYVECLIFDDCSLINMVKLEYFSMSCVVSIHCLDVGVYVGVVEPLMGTASLLISHH